MMRTVIGVFVAAFVAAILISSSVFVVDQKHDAIVRTFGEIKEVVTEPGLHFKEPFIQTVVLLDKRIQTIDNPDPDHYITAEKKNLLVDLYVKWHILDARRYFLSVGGDPTTGSARLTQIIRAALNEEFTKRTVREVVSDEREKVMQTVLEKVSHDAQQIGIQVIDVRLKRVDLLATISDSVYTRMEAERQRAANEQRSTGGAEAEQIKADADRQSTVILADAYQKAQSIKGEGDAKASQIYAEAFGRDPQFYQFYKSLEAYKASFNDRHDLIVVDPTSEFFKYMKNPAASAAPAKK